MGKRLDCDGAGMPGSPGGHPGPPGPRGHPGASRVCARLPSLHFRQLDLLPTCRSCTHQRLLSHLSNGKVDADTCGFLLAHLLTYGFAHDGRGTTQSTAGCTLELAALSQLSWVPDNRRSGWRLTSPGLTAFFKHRGPETSRLAQGSPLGRGTPAWTSLSLVPGFFRLPAQLSFTLLSRSPLGEVIVLVPGPVGLESFRARQLFSVRARVTRSLRPCVPGGHRPTPRLVPTTGSGAGAGRLGAAPSVARSEPGTKGALRSLDVEVPGTDASTGTKQAGRGRAGCEALPEATVTAAFSCVVDSIQTD